MRINHSGLTTEGLIFLYKAETWIRTDLLARSTGLTTSFLVILIIVEGQVDVRWWWWRRKEELVCEVPT